MRNTPLQRRLIAFAAIGLLTTGSMLVQAAPSFAAETGDISGRVVDASNSGVADADVTLTAPTGSYKTHTNSKGEFVIVGVLSDTYTVVVSVNGSVQSTEPGVFVAGNQFTEIAATAAQS